MPQTTNTPTRLLPTGPLTEQERDRIRALVAEHGSSGARRVLDLPRAVYERALSGLPMRMGSVSMVRLRLVEIDLAKLDEPATGEAAQ